MKKASIPWPKSVLLNEFAGCTVHRMRPCIGKHDTYHIRTTCSQLPREIVFKSPKLTRSERWVEPALLEKLNRDTAIPVPPVLASGMDSTGRPWMVMEHVDGTSLADIDTTLFPTKARDVLPQIGKELAILHDGFEFESAGYPAVLNEKIQVDKERNWKTMFADDVRGHLDYLDEKPILKKLPDFDSFLDSLSDDVYSEERTLVHSDVRLKNVVLDEECKRLRSVLDWEKTVIGDPVLDVVRTAEFLARWPYSNPEISADLERRLLRAYSSIRTIGDISDEVWRRYAIELHLSALVVLDAWTDKWHERRRRTCVNYHCRLVSDLLAD